LGGTEISFILGIDYTESNGHPSDSKSLHCNNGEPNAYTTVIQSFGDIVTPYIKDGKISVSIEFFDIFLILFLRLLGLVPLTMGHL
jgi:hypothetical protein